MAARRTDDTRFIDLNTITQPSRYFAVLAKWLEMEAIAEREQIAARRAVRSRKNVERTGETLLDMENTDHQTGLAGRLLLTFAKPNGGSLPMNRLKVGAPVIVSDDLNPDDSGIPGVVSRRKGSTIQVALDKWPAGVRFRIDLSPDETTRQRQLSAMQRAMQATGRGGQFRSLLLGERTPHFVDDEEIDDQPLDFFSQLNPPQRDAVRFALAADDLAVIHGPPGTGKTTTVAELIVQAVRRGERVLACAPSNTAVDNLLERLVKMMPNVIRVGHPARVFEWLRGHTLDELVEADPSSETVRLLMNEVESLLQTASRMGHNRPSWRL
ncbi:MAG: AAA domain-containing protein, partial [Planctomycetota bacterium]